MDIFIAHSMPVVMVAWVSIVQSRQLVTHKHFYAYSHEALNRYFCILLACVKAGTVGFLGYPVTLLFITKVLYITALFKTDKLSSNKH